MSISIRVLLFAFCASCAAAVAQPYGIESRAPNTALLISDLPADNPGTMRVERAFPRLGFGSPVFLTHAGDDSGRLFVVEQGGIIRVFPRGADPAPSSVATFLDISGRVSNSGEQGLLGLAFDPNYAANGRFYVYYSWNGTNPGTSRVSRFTNDDPAGNSVNPATEQIILSVAQPYTNHNGGMIAFGPDGMLHVGFGDGGSGGDPQGNGQNTRTLLGSMLRIDVRAAPDAGLAYHIPTDNPFYTSGPAGAATRREIYAYGLRNPWRWSFDALNGFLFAGDVGQGAREEIDVIRAAGNCGWNIMEGSQCYPPSAATCDRTGLTLPIADYGRGEGSSVTGGYVYYGSAVPDLYGMYLYGDFGSGRIWGLRHDGAATQGPYVLVASSGLNISSFGQDDDGEVYVLGYGGTINVLRPASGGGGASFPTRLSDMPALLAVALGQDRTGLGIIPYAPAAPLWSDGALKERFFALPNLDTIGYRDSGGWDFPENSVAIKNFVLPLDERNPTGATQRIETRLLYRKNNVWNGFSYEWNDEQTDAVLLTTSKTKAFSITDRRGEPVELRYLYPSRSQCNQCHTSATGGLLGLSTPQMNRDFQFPASGVTDNQLRTYDHVGLFGAALADSPNNLPRMPDPFDATAATLEARARAYLAANCSMCHRPGGTAPTALDLRWEATLAEMNAIGVRPGNGDLGVSGARIISTSDPEKSVLLRRMETRDGGLTQMPPLATSRVDEDGVALVREWIRGLQATEAGALWISY